MENLGIVVGIVATIGAGLIWIITLLINRAKHEDMQDIEIKSIEIARNECTIEREKMHGTIIRRIENLEKRDTDREIMLAQIKEKMESLIQGHEHTQSMISQLTEHQQTTFSELIKTINNMGSK